MKTLDTARLREEYISRVNRVIDFIENHLDEELPLNRCAGVAHFSPFHFHRIFKAFMNESLSQYVQRIRLEKAARLLSENPKRSITRIAMDCGFASSAHFARCFKDYFSMNASQWRTGGKEKYYNNRKISQNNSKISQMESTIRKEFYQKNPYTWIEINNSGDSDMINQSKLKIEVKDLPALNVAYVRHVGAYKGDSALFERLFGQLCAWAGPRGLINEKAGFLSVYHDSPDITDEDKLRVSVCITVPEETAVEGEIGSMTIPAGKYALAYFEINVDQYEEAWTAVYKDWLPESGYQPAEGLCFEKYLNDPKSHPEGKHILYICIPVKPL